MIADLVTSWTCLVSSEYSHISFCACHCQILIIPCGKHKIRGKKALIFKIFLELRTFKLFLETENIENISRTEYSVVLPHFQCPYYKLQSKSNIYYPHKIEDFLHFHNGNIYSIPMATIYHQNIFLISTYDAERAATVTMRA